MVRLNKTGKGSNEKNHIFEVGDIVKIVPNHRPFTRSTMKYPHGKELINQVCFVEQLLGDRYSLYALEKPAKSRYKELNEKWYLGDILGSCLEPHTVKFNKDEETGKFIEIIHSAEDSGDQGFLMSNKMALEAIREYKHFIYKTDMEEILCRMKQQEIENLR